MFDLDAYLAGLGERLLALPEGRRALTELDPLLLALIYLPHCLRAQETGAQITFSQAHYEWCGLARRYVAPFGDREVRLVPLRISSGAGASGKPAVAAHPVRLRRARHGVSGGWNPADASAQRVEGWQNAPAGSFYSPRAGRVSSSGRSSRAIHRSSSARLTDA